jgi:hypothetical protein
MSKENETHKMIGVDLASDKKDRTVTTMFVGGIMCGKTTFMEAMKNIKKMPGLTAEECAIALSNASYKLNKKDGKR